MWGNHRNHTPAAPPGFGPWGPDARADTPNEGVAVIEFFDHTADLGFRIRARSLPGLFYLAARGLSQALFAKPPHKGARWLEVRLRAPDLETLLVRWLGELLYLIQTKGEVPAGMRLRLCRKEGDWALQAHLAVAPLDLSQMGFLGEVKGVTFHGLSIERRGTRYEAAVILDV